jgi:hypothetical protein
MIDDVSHRRPDADVVCLQEVSPLSYDGDFAFMKDLGYDSNEMFKKGRFRPATFWKSSRCFLMSDPVHKDRTLLTAFRLRAQPIDQTGIAPFPPPGTWYVLNCHLQAGKQGSRRLRQIHEGAKAVMTLCRKLERGCSKSLRLIVCGDFNGGAECGAVRFLEDGFVDETFREDGQAISSGRKALPLDQPMQDAVLSVDREPPSTLVVPELMSIMIQGGSYENLVLSEAVTTRLTTIFDRLATQYSPDRSTQAMSKKDVEQYLIAVNGKVGRGSEFREAARQMGWVAKGTLRGPDEEDEDNEEVSLPENGVLTLAGFLGIYENELKQGKFWGIAHDLAVLGEPLPDVGVFQSRFDESTIPVLCSPQPLLIFAAPLLVPTRLNRLTTFQ